MRWVWAQNEKGFITKCYLPPDLRGKGCCSHVLFQEEGESESDFVRRIRRRDAEIRKEHAAWLLNTDSVIRISSKGVQDKWHVKNHWYKGDGPVHEGLHEAIVTSLLEGSNLEYVQYKTCAIFRNGKDTGINGCVSEDFLPDGSSEITLLQVLGKAGSKRFLTCGTIREKLDVLVDEIYKRTSLNARDYLMKIVCLDYTTLNHDRHLENITFFQKEDGTFQFAPCFDNGCALDNAIVGDEAVNPLSMFLTMDSQGNIHCSTLSEYASLIRESGPLLELAPGIQEKLANWSDALYTPFEVRKTKTWLLRRLQETEGCAWKFRET